VLNGLPLLEDHPGVRPTAAHPHRLKGFTILRSRMALVAARYSPDFNGQPVSEPAHKRLITSKPSFKGGSADLAAFAKTPTPAVDHSLLSRLNHFENFRSGGSPPR